jgi:hypothetical protein
MDGCAVVRLQRAQQPLPRPLLAQRTVPARSRQQVVEHLQGRRASAVRCWGIRAKEEPPAKGLQPAFHEYVQHFRVTPSGSRELWRAFLWGRARPEWVRNEWRLVMRSPDRAAPLPPGGLRRRSPAPASMPLRSLPPLPRAND